MIYRPWGPLDWLSRKLSDPVWSILGVSGTEDRCCSVSHLVTGDRRQTARFLRIVDPAPLNEAEYVARLDQVARDLTGLGASAGDFESVQLLADVDTIREQVTAFVDTSGPNVIVDITSMPKWWFSPSFCYLALADVRVETLVATYASAEHYGPDLSVNPRPLGPIPTFGGTSKSARIIRNLLLVSGFAPLGLKDLYSEHVERVARYLFPFPPGFTQFPQESKTFPKETFRQRLITRIGVQTIAGTCTCTTARPSSMRSPDLPTTRRRDLGARADEHRAEDRITGYVFVAPSQAEEPQTNPPFPGYFPAQPQRYALDYTSGMKMVDNVPDVRAYCLRLNGRSIYELPPEP